MRYNNCLKDQALDKTLDETCEVIYQILSEHCGPLCEYAFIKDVKCPTDDGNFTKDGINIVRSLEFDTPIQNALKNTIAHIGSSVERIAADGTTSSMMIAIEALRELRANPIIRKAPTAIFTAAWKEFESVIRARYKSAVYNMNKLCQDIYGIVSDDIASDKQLQALIRGITYSQTYTSSHGDTNFALQVANLFCAVPKEAWKTINVRRADYETEDQYKIEYDYSEWTFQKVGIIPFNQRLSENIDGTLIRHNERCVFSILTPLLGGDLDSQDLIKRIHKSIQENEQVTYIVPSNIDANSRNSLDQLFFSNPNTKTTVIFVIPEKDGLPSELEIMPLLINGYKGEPIYERTCDYTSNGKSLQIFSGIHEFEHSEICMTHPWIGDTTNHKEYNEFLNQLQKSVDKAASDFDKSSANLMWYDNSRKLLNKLKVINRISFVVGGSLYNNLTAVDIVHDTLPAVRKSLEEGFCLGGCKTLYAVIQDVYNNFSNNFYRKDCAWEIEEICKAFLHAIEKLDKCIVQYSKMSWKDKRNYKFDCTSTTNVITKRQRSVLDLIYTGSKESNGAVIMQPIETDMELLKRFGEMCIRFIKTNKMITVGTIVKPQQ